MELMTNRARAYINFGRWVAECPYQCGSALRLDPHQAMFHCKECGSMAEIEWPAEADAIWAALAKRRAPKNRNWFPDGHQLALRSGAPHGQSVAELEEETRAFEGGA